MSELTQIVEDLKVGIGALIGGGLAGLVVWAKAKRTHAGVSRDELSVAENKSQEKWIASQEAAIQQERELRMAAEAQARLAFEELNESLKRLREADSRNDLLKSRVNRLHARNQHLIRLLTESRPEIAAFLVTEPAPLDSKH